MDRKERHRKRVQSSIDNVMKASTFHIVVGDIADESFEEKHTGKVVFENIKLAHSIDAPGDVMKVFDIIRDAVIKDLEGYLP